MLEQISSYFCTQSVKRERPAAGERKNAAKSNEGNARDDPGGREFCHLSNNAQMSHHLFNQTGQAVKTPKTGQAKLCPCLMDRQARANEQENSQKSSLSDMQNCSSHGVSPHPAMLA